MTAKHSWWVAAVLVVLPLLAGIATRHWLAVAATAESLGALSPEPRLTDLEGKERSIGEWRGKVVVLNFWASWCSPCREEMPEFKRLQEEFGDRGLQFIGIAIDEADAVREFLQASPVNYPILLGDEKTPDWANRLGNRISALPFSVIIDRDGKPVRAHMGILRRDDLLSLVRPLLKP